ISDVFLKAMRAVGVAADGSQLDQLAVGGAAATSLQTILLGRGVAPTARLICININASSLDYKRRWPLDSYRELIERILAELRGYTLVLIGAPEDVAYVAGLMRALPSTPHLVDLCGAITLPELALLLQRSQLFIGNDSGPLHLAAAAGIPTVSFFGPET